jgi:hypothetical protein
MVLQGTNNQSGFRLLILLLLVSAAAALLISAVSAEKPFVTIVAQGSQSYYMNEDVVFSGMNTDSSSTYLFIVGPGISANGGSLLFPHGEVVSGDPGTFVRVATKPDKTWEYTYTTHNLGLNPGTYTIYVVSQPNAKDQLAQTPYGTVDIILKKPFITAGITPSPVTKGQPFTITGSAEGNPSVVQVWIIGDNYVYTAAVPVNPDSTYTFNGDTQLSGKLPAGQNYLIVQHPMANRQFDIIASGDYVRTLQGTNGMNLFRIAGTGSLQGTDAAETLIAAMGDQKNGDDKYTEIPFMVSDAGTMPGGTTSALPAPTSPLVFAPVGAIVLIFGIFVWKRR